MKTLNEMTGPELVAAYNEIAKILDEPLVTRFPSRAAGVKRVEKIRALNDSAKGAKVVSDETCPHCGIELINGVLDYTSTLEDDDPERRAHAKEFTHEYQCMACGGYFGKKIVRRNNPKNHGAAIAASWNNEEVRAKRSQRNAVLVDGVEYRSVKAAFIALDMPLKMHIKFRMELKAEGKMDWAGKTWEIV